MFHVHEAGSSWSKDTLCWWTTLRLVIWFLFCRVTEHSILEGINHDVKGGHARQMCVRDGISVNHKCKMVFKFQWCNWVEKLQFSKRAVIFLRVKFTCETIFWKIHSLPFKCVLTSFRIYTSSWGQLSCLCLMALWYWVCKERNMLEPGDEFSAPWTGIDCSSLYSNRQFPFCFRSVFECLLRKACFHILIASFSIINIPH